MIVGLAQHFTFHEFRMEKNLPNRKPLEFRLTGATTWNSEERCSAAEQNQNKR
jgi:hypothetical protein